ncbi:unnamed protein product [Nezara viridula]|uniref:CREB-regulated transcription coactivator 1 n=1 Tax=Nezara viridula TaxID=85310 RepID=A0A9P0E7A1_NEZVI|nr:unnamed protein product [Nezara viridula]
MANPRKFSEKIALHHQKQAEETAEFEKIMREVSDATNRQSLTSLDDLRNSHQHHPLVYRERPRSAALGPMRSRPAEKRIDTSPYSGSYLSPPLDTTWRRTHSDSSLHTSSHENNSHRRGVNECHTQVNDDYESMKRSFSCNPEARPRSALDMPRVPGISIYPSQQEPGAIQIPIANNTGSLPDLSNFHIPSPLDVPIDQEETHCYNNSHSGSPRSLSPTQLIRNNKFTLVGTSPTEAPGPPYAMNHSDTHHRQFCQSRTSSQMSPQLSMFKYSNTSPSSSPQSPPSPTSSLCKMSPVEANNYYITQEDMTLQHHFEQFSVREDSCPKLRSHEMTQDPGYFSTSPHQYSRVPLEHAASTPSSIPDIILTDFSNGEDLGKDFGVNMVDNLDLFPTDECLREGLVPIDIDGLQMLTDPSMIADPATEDHLRLDRL